jgi:hypothetical protein
MIQISSFSFENEYGETLHVDVDLTGATVRLKSKDGFTVEKIADLEQIVERITKALDEIEEINRRK